MEQFDQFFNKKFQERQLELNQEHWLEAEKLIIAQEKKKRRRWLFFWFFGALAGFAVIGLFWLTLDNSTDNSINETAQKNINTQSNENNLITEIAETKTIDQLTSNTPEEGAEVPLDATNSSSLKTKTTTTNPTDKNSKLPSSTFNLEVDKAISKLPPNQAINSEEQSIDNSINLSSDQATSPQINQTPNHPITQSTSQPNTPSTNNSITQSTSQPNTPSTNNSITQSTSQPNTPSTNNSINKSTSQPIDLIPDSLVQALEEGREEFKPEIVETTLLPYTPIYLLEYNVDYAIDEYLKINERKDNHPETKNNPFLSADFNISAYPYISSDTKPILGFKAGLSWGKPLNQSLTLVAALNYEFRGGTFDRYKESNQVAYRFSKAEERFILVPDNLHYGEVSSLLAWQRGKSLFETGAGLNYLIGVRGELQRFTSDDNFESATVESKGWLVEDGFKKWHIKAMLGYSHRFSSKLGLGIRLNYAIGTILDKNYQTSEVFLKENQPLTLDLRFRYYFLTNK